MTSNLRAVLLPGATAELLADKNHLMQRRWLTLVPASIFIGAQIYLNHFCHQTPPRLFKSNHFYPKLSEIGLPIQLPIPLSQRMAISPCNVAHEFLKTGHWTNIYKGVYWRHFDDLSTGLYTWEDTIHHRRVIMSWMGDHHTPAIRHSKTASTKCDFPHYDSLIADHCITDRERAVLYIGGLKARQMFYAMEALLKNNFTIYDEGNFGRLSKIKETLLSLRIEEGSEDDDGARQVFINPHLANLASSVTENLKFVGFKDGLMMSPYFGYYANKTDKDDLMNEVANYEMNKTESKSDFTLENYLDREFELKEESNSTHGQYKYVVLDTRLKDYIMDEDRKGMAKMGNLYFATRTTKLPMAFKSAAGLYQQWLNFADTLKKYNTTKFIMISDNEIGEQDHSNDSPERASFKQQVRFANNEIRMNLDMLFKEYESNFKNFFYS